MIRRALIYAGRLIFIIVFLTSIHAKWLHEEGALAFYRKHYEYVQVSVRSFGVIMPRTS